MQPPLQQTRFQRLILGSGERLQEWAINPWRRLSLQLIVLLSSYMLGGAVGSISGALARLDPLSALICVLTIEVAARIRGPLLRQPGQRLAVSLLDMARIGLLYGLLLDGFKLL
ncbi:MAG: DUF565 domain-containing protein [Cyanobacteriota bacterium]|nr:DUF565 domain-containing protein [Cyanobacteriota bacterium]